MSFTALSTILFVAGIYIYRKTNPSKANVGLFFVMASGSLLLFFAYGAAYYFTGNGIDEATIYHLKYGLDGAGLMGYGWLIVSTVTAIILFAIYLMWFIPKSTHGKKPHTFHSRLSYSLLSVSLLLNPGTIDVYHLQAKSLMPRDQSDSQTSEDFHAFYRKPSIEASGNSQKNIVFIYAESLERTYFDETLFPGLIKGIRELEAISTYFTNIMQVSATGWTVAGMTASQCGIPLFTPSDGNSMSGMDQFLSSAVCLGDLLSSAGYHLSYMGGASLEFAGKGKLYRTHGFSDVSGRDELLPKFEKEPDKSAWGLYDDSLFDLTYRRFIELSETGEKFGLFTLTLDTHGPDGYRSKSCRGIHYSDDPNSILNAVACSDFLITSFIKKITQSPYADQTVVVLASDHFAMRNTVSELLEKQDRKNLFMIFDPSASNSVEIQTAGSTLDIGPTILPFLGYTGEIGLGRNLLDDTEREEDRIFIHANLQKWEKFITEFWNFPTIQDTLEIYIDRQIVRIDDRSFRMPILIELNDRLESTLMFQTNKYYDGDALIQYRKDLAEDKYFLLVDRCANAKRMDNALGEDGFCLLMGQGSSYTKIEKLDKNTIFTAHEIRHLLNLQNTAELLAARPEAMTGRR